MRCFGIIVLLFPILFFGQDQRSHFNMDFAAGPGYFFNDAPAKQGLQSFEQFGLTYFIYPNGKQLMFEPGIHVQMNRYRTAFGRQGLVHVKQLTAGVDLDALLRLRKRLMLRVGLAFNQVMQNSIEVSHDSYNSRGYYSNDGLYEGYSQQAFQAAVGIGFCFEFKLFRREQKFNIKVSHAATSVVKQDFWLDKSRIGEDVKVLDAKARPTMLVFSLEIRLQKLKKKSDPAEQE